MKITIVQLHVQWGKEQNIAHLKELLIQPLNTDMIVLPEMWVSPYQNDAFLTHSITPTDTFFTVLPALAKAQNAYIVAGSVPEKTAEGLYNTTFVFGPSGDLVTQYRKIHLFEITYPDKTQYRENDVIQKGSNLVTFKTPFGTIGLMICFDIRFPLFAHAYQKAGCDLIIVPAAFNQYTGPAHWELTFRSRAVDNQLFMIGVSPAVSSEGSYQYYGHSIVVNPFGEVLLEMSEDENISTIELDIDDVQKIRKAFPIILNETVL